MILAMGRIFITIILFFLVTFFITKKEYLVIGDSITADGRFVDYLNANVEGINFHKLGFVGKNSSFISRKFQSMNISTYDGVIIEVGINNIDKKYTVIIDIQIMVSLAKSKGLKVIVLTLPPFKGYKTWTPEKQANLEYVNFWILTKMKDADQVINIYADLQYDGYSRYSIDHLHLGKNGNLMLGKQIKEYISWK